MQIISVHIKNFKSIEDMEITDIENALILVGKNNTGKTGILDAIRAAASAYDVTKEDFNEKKQKIEIIMTLAMTKEDLELFHREGIVSQYKRFETWLHDFKAKLPSYQEGKLTFTYQASWNGEIRFFDGHHKNNRYIKEVMPRLYYIDSQRELNQFQNDLLLFQEDDQLSRLRDHVCMFDSARECSQCFQCIGLINQKKPEELAVYETAKLLEYKMYQLNLNDFAARVNENYRKNGGYEEIRFSLICDPNQMFRVTAETYHEERGKTSPISNLSNGMRSLYMLSLLEAYTEDGKKIPNIIIVEDPEIFLHPQLQKTSSEILYRLSKKNQVIFTTHSPNMLFNFTSRQIRQVVLDRGGYSVVKEKTDIDVILDDLGYGAIDLLGVSFVFIVEGKQDKSRLPLLLEKYYSEIYDKEGNLSRISIITTNSCTNIKTYANLKYMNQVYLRDQFLMIRDGDGRDPEELAGELCRYYEERGKEEIDRLPKVTRRNVLILKYYSFENYFFNPKIMEQLGIVESEESFYERLFEKWNEYLHRLKSGKQFLEAVGKNMESPEELKEHMEEFKIYMRGHNLFDIFYGPYRKQEAEILRKYIDLAPREEFKDILDAIDRFVYFENRKVEK
ncbi:MULTISPECIES: AAA family ATPase [Lacrimispora]|uniref:ATP-dependent nuclease n=1 Tax=Lacrimispora TaxID=2719231 RepID=UPI000BE40596|nr:AAA family ATPase [Lacrimispora amygdalina]MDK2965924.1 putative ATP-dependent endonuclease of the family [Lacrimispora sp.]